MCKSLCSNFFGLSTLSDSNPVSRRFCSIDSYLFDFSLSLTLSATNQPTTRNNEDTPSSLPSQKTTRSKGRKERKKKRRIKPVYYIYIPIYINPRKEME